MARAEGTHGHRSVHALLKPASHDSKRERSGLETASYHLFSQAQDQLWRPRQANASRYEPLDAHGRARLPNCTTELYRVLLFCTQCQAWKLCIPWRVHHLTILLNCLIAYASFKSIYMQTTAVHSCVLPPHDPSAPTLNCLMLRQKHLENLLDFSVFCIRILCFSAFQSLDITNQSARPKSSKSDASVSRQVNHARAAHAGAQIAIRRLQQLAAAVVSGVG